MKISMKEMASKIIEKRRNEKREKKEMAYESEIIMGARTAGTVTRYMGALLRVAFVTAHPTCRSTPHRAHAAPHHAARCTRTC